MKKTIYWAVTAKCGHVGGLSKYIPITFYITASSKKEASDITVSIPRVKHNSKQVILDIRNISKEEYSEGVQRNAADPYLKCKSVQEQKYLCHDLHERTVDETDEFCKRVSDRIHKRKAGGKAYGGGKQYKASKYKRACFSMEEYWDVCV